MESIGLRELRQDASGILRRVEEGAEVVITVAGRPSARLVSASPRRWRRWDDIANLFHGSADPDWNKDRDEIAQELRDPWADR